MLINKILIPLILIDIFDLFFPEECINCGKTLEIKRKFLCLYCLSEAPLTHFSYFADNQVENIFRGRVPIVAATSLLFFEKKGMVQKLIHELKYRNKPEIGVFIGHWLGENMLSGMRFTSIDAVVPVPLHPAKERKRGYNQVSMFAQTLAECMGVELKNDLLQSKKERMTQTSKNRMERMNETHEVFCIKNDQGMENRHILLVDDVITTGATIEACCYHLLKIKGVRLSIASMAFTS